MATGPVLELASGRLQLDRYEDPILVDPDATLLSAVLDALRATRVPVAEGTAESADVSTSPAHSDGSGTVDLPDPLVVVAREPILSATTDGFGRASEVAALLERDLVRFRVLATPQPNALLLGRRAATLLVSTSLGTYALPVADPEGLRRRYAHLHDGSDPFAVRTPSRDRVFEAFADRCDAAVATAVLVALDTPPDPSHDLLDTRLRAAMIGARHNVDDYVFRRACEEAGLGSPSTFTSIKRRLLDADLIATERVPQPVGRPRQRLRLGPALIADTESSTDVSDAENGVAPMDDNPTCGERVHSIRAVLSAARDVLSRSNGSPMDPDN